MDDFVLLDDAERDDVNEAILVEARIEIRVARYVWHTNRVAVCADAVDGALRDIGLVRSIEGPESQRIGESNYLGAHAKHVAHDAADTGRRTLEGHDLRRMVM